MPRAYIVIGAESSGTRYMTSLLIAAGCHGDSTHEQRWDNSLPDDHHDIVWRRSFPHGPLMPNLALMVNRVEQAGYEPLFVITVRSVLPCVESHIIQEHSRDRTHARDKIAEAMRSIWGQLKDLQRYPWIMVTYEDLMTSVERRKDFIRSIGLDESRVETHPAKNANIKYSATPNWIATAWE